MSSWLDVKYLNLLSSQLRNFKRKSQNLWNFSCVYCGDSLRNKRKARGYVYLASSTYLFTCHNCGLSTSARNLIKYVNPVLYDEYLKELLSENRRPDKIEEFAQEIKKKVVFDICPLKQLKSIDTLDDEHPGRSYVMSRQIPESWHSKLYFCPRFMTWTNSLLPEPKFREESLRHDEPRLIIPFLTRDGKLYGYQGRSLKPNAEIRYISIILDENYPKLFGLEQVDEDRRFYLFEGPFDAMFVKNSLAVAGGELLQVLGHVNKNNVVLVFDNEPFSKIICKKMQKAINLDYRVVVWPKDLVYKDVNDMILSGLEAEFVKQLIDLHTKRGLEAELDFNNWKRVTL